MTKAFDFLKYFFGDQKEHKEMGQLKARAERWDEWHGTWLESTLNEFFDKYSVKTIKSEILRYILEDDANHDEVVHLMFYETVKDYMKDKATPGMYDNPDAVPTPATIDTMFELDTPIVGEMYETFCEHYGI
tara:strand:- start:409 stop:804 length:396 start_codon:yes stop_codon:yes gene_type:complete